MRHKKIIRIIKILLPIVVVAVLLYPFLSPYFKYLDMFFYIKDATDIGVIYVDDGGDGGDEEKKYIQITVAINTDEDVRLDKIIAFRNALDEFLKNKKNSYLNQDWMITIKIENGSGLGTTLLDYSAYIANWASWECEKIGEHQFVYDVSKELNTLYFELDAEDIPYISELDGIEHLGLCGNYVDLGDDVMYETIEQIRKLDGLKSVSVYTEWYDAFVEADLDCKVYEDLRSRNDREL